MLHLSRLVQVPRDERKNGRPSEGPFWVMELQLQDALKLHKFKNARDPKRERVLC